jgi:hypothetical protein
MPAQRTAMGVERVYSVDEVVVRIIRTNPPYVTIHAQGRSVSTGWSNGQLAKQVHVSPPVDGVQAYDFKAQAPTASKIPVLTPISGLAELPDVDIRNYWGNGMPLRGIRVHAVANRKTVEVVDRKESAELIARMSPRALASYVTPAPDVPGFQEDIKPLFRDRDVLVMEAIAGFNLHAYEDVKTNADRILQRLREDMPCDGLWPEDDIAKFEAWKNGGMPA